MRGFKMNYKTRFFGSTLSTLQQALVAALTATMLLAIPVAGNAQETSSAIRGTVTDEAGRPGGRCFNYPP